LRVNLSKFDKTSRAYFLEKQGPFH